MRVTVNLGSSLRRRNLPREVEIELLPQATIKTLVERLREIYGETFRFPLQDAEGRYYVKFVLNGKYVTAATALADGDEVWLIIPAGGG
jgi:molybdopterin converting factor small subunit